jgi:pyruvate/2-oxoglutarate dehydrogenase complex dihydrolipoamide dehydrogenase (E3) component
MTPRANAPTVLPPGDELNRALRDHTHPPDWPVRPANSRYDLVAIGGGTAGLVAAGGAALLGARAAMIERALLGGDCLVTGCVPSKALLAAAGMVHAARRAGEFGIRVGPIEVDFPAVMERVRRVRAAIAPHDGAEGMRGRGVDVLFGHARFTGPSELDLDGRPVRFRRAVICTGARPAMPESPGLSEHGMTSETLFELSELPSRLVVLGGGPVGCEMAQAFARLGSKVTLVQRAPRLLPRDDPAAGDLLADAFREEGIDVRLGAEVTRVESGVAGLTVHSTEAGHPAETATDRVLVAAGRRPNVDGLGLEVAGVAYDAHGVRVNRRHRTTNPRVYAAGDVCSHYQFTHAAYSQAEFACLNALLPIRLNARDRVMSWVTYTDPEVAHVGPAWDALSGTDSFTQPVATNDRALTEGETRGFARIHCRRGTDRVVAATVVGRAAGEVIPALAVAIANGLRLRHVQRTIFPYPTRAESVRKAADEWRFATLTPRVRRLLELWFRWSRLWG